MNSKYIISLFTALAISYPVLSSANIFHHKATTEQVQVEEKILGTLITLNKNEIATGHLANKKSSNKDVKSFANLMIKEHGDNLKKTENISKALGIKVIQSKELQDKGKKELATLKKLKGSAFDKAYIDAMVTGHIAVLSLIDTLISNTSNPVVKHHLKATRPHVKDHLEKAKAIQKSFQ